MGPFWANWYTGANFATTSPEEDYNSDPAYNKLVEPQDPEGPFQRNWELREASSFTGDSKAYWQDNTYRK